MHTSSVPGGVDLDINASTTMVSIKAVNSLAIKRCCVTAGTGLRTQNNQPIALRTAMYTQTARQRFTAHFGKQSSPRSGTCFLTHVIAACSAFGSISICNVGFGRKRTPQRGRRQNVRPDHSQLNHTLPHVVTESFCAGSSSTPVTRNAVSMPDNDDGWILVGTAKAYTPCELDIGHCLQLRVSVRD